MKPGFREKNTYLKRRNGGERCIPVKKKKKKEMKASSK